MEWSEVDGIAAQHGDSFFLFDEERFRRNYQELLASFRSWYEPTHIGYSYKTNYTPYLCRIVDELGGFAEVVSSMEYQLARRLGVQGERIIYNGPCKGEDSFADAAIQGATLNLDGARDLSLIQAVASEHPGRGFQVVLRCNFSIGTDAISRFGMDVEGAEFADALRLIDSTNNLSLSGLHCHFPDRDLPSFGRRAERLVALALQLLPDEGPRTLNIGGGFMSHMPEGLAASLGGQRVTFADYGELVGGILAEAFAASASPPRLLLEPGTALVADTFRFFARVMDVKDVRGHRFATVAGSIFDISPSARVRTLPVRAIHQGGAPGAAPTAVVGFTCIEGDVLSEAVPTELAVGDFVEFGNVGSYSVVMRPPFILPASPVLVLAPDSDGVHLIRRRETFDHVFHDFVM